MNPMILFLANRLLSRSFWLLVVSTFLGVLLLQMRSWHRGQILAEALRTINPGGRFYGNRF